MVAEPANAVDGRFTLIAVQAKPNSFYTVDGSYTGADL